MKNDGAVEQVHKKSVVCVLKSVPEQEYSLEVPGTVALSKSSRCSYLGKDGFP